MKTLILFIFIIVFPFLTCLAETYYVDPSNTNNSNSIQEAINMARRHEGNHRVIVLNPNKGLEPYTYQEDIKVNLRENTACESICLSKNKKETGEIRLSSSSNSAAIEVLSGKDTETVIEGFTICGSVYGIKAKGGDREKLKISDCEIRNNLFGILDINSNLQIRNCNISRNYDCGIMEVGNNKIENISKEIFHSFINSNGSYGLYLDKIWNIVNCTITNNEEGGIFATNRINIINNIIRKNDTQIDVDKNCNVIYSDIQDRRTGEGNIDEDPLFVDSWS